jgi:hypothetical protein
MRHVFGVILLFIAGIASAAPVTWTLNGVTFDDGGTATGQFDYDADLKQYSNVSITTSFVNEYPSQIYNLAEPADSSPTSLYAWSIESPGALVLFFIGSPAAAGDTVEIATTSYEVYGEFPVERYVTSGTVSSVPIPAAVWLFGSALAGLGWLRRKQTA